MTRPSPRRHRHRAGWSCPWAADPTAWHPATHCRDVRSAFAARLRRALSACGRHGARCAAFAPHQDDLESALPTLAAPIAAAPRRGTAAMPSPPPSRPPCSRPRRPAATSLVSAQTGSGKTVAFGLAIAPDAAGRGRAARPAPAPLGPGHRADARTGAAGAARAGLALCARPAPRRLLRRRHGHPRTSAARSNAARISSSARPGACATISSAAALDLAAPAGRRAGRGRRDARPRLPRGPRVHPRRRPGRAPHAAVLGHRPARDRRTGQALPARRPAHRRHRRARASMATSTTAPCAWRPDERRARGRQPAALLRAPRTAPGLLLHARRGAAACTRNLVERGFSVVALSGELSQTERTQRPAGAARRPRPRLRRHRRGRARHRPARSRRWSSTPTCPSDPRRCCTARAAPAARARRASAR